MSLLVQKKHVTNVYIEAGTEGWESDVQQVLYLDKTEAEEAEH